MAISARPVDSHLRGLSPNAQSQLAGTFQLPSDSHSQAHTRSLPEVRRRPSCPLRCWGMGSVRWMDTVRRRRQLPRRRRAGPCGNSHRWPVGPDRTGRSTRFVPIRDPWWWVCRSRNRIPGWASPGRQMKGQRAHRHQPHPPPAMWRDPCGPHDATTGKQHLDSEDRQSGRWPSSRPRDSVKPHSCRIAAILRHGRSGYRYWR